MESKGYIKKEKLLELSKQWLDFYEAAKKSDIQVRTKGIQAMECARALDKIIYGEIK